MRTDKPSTGIKARCTHSPNPKPFHRRSTPSHQQPPPPHHPPPPPPPPTPRHNRLCAPKHPSKHLTITSQPTHPTSVMLVLAILFRNLPYPVHSAAGQNTKESHK